MLSAYYVGVSAFYPFMHLSFFLSYSFICLRNFYENPRFFGKNSSLNDWYHSRRMRELGINPETVHSGLTLIVAFVASYMLFSRISSSEDKESTEKQEVVKCETSADRPDIPFTVPYCDIYTTKSSMWGSKTESVDWPKSVVNLDDLIIKAKKNQVRITVSTPTSNISVGGTMLHSNLVASVYHAIRNLGREGSSLTVHKRINGAIVKTVDREGYVKDGVSALPTMTQHIDATRDIVALCLGSASSPSLSKYVIRSFTTKRKFKAAIVYTEKDGTEKSYTGIGEETIQSVSVDNSKDIMYTGRLFSFVPSDSTFQSFNGICGGLMLAYESKRAAIVGVLAATFTVQLEDEMVKRVAALPINEAGVDFSAFGTAIPSSFPDELRTVTPIPIEVQPPSSSSKFHHYYHSVEDDLVEQRYGSTEVLGVVPNSTVHPSSQTKFYEWESDILKEFPEFSHDLVPPAFRHTRNNGEFVSPGRHAMYDLRYPMRHVSIPYHLAAVQNMLDEVQSYIGIYDVYAPLEYLGDVSLSFSGVHGSSVHQGIKRTTGAGFPWNGKKSDYFVYNVDDTIRLKPEIASHLGNLFTAYAEGKRQGVISRGTYKDEPRSKEKVADRKIRLFAPSEFDKYLAAHIIWSSAVQASVISRNKRMTLGGMSVFSEEFAEIRTSREKTHPYVVLLDFKKFDKCTSLRCLLASKNMDLSCIRQGRWYNTLTFSEKSTFVTMYHTLASDLVEGLLIVDGELLFPQQGTQSGGVDTYKQNCETHNMIAREAILLIIEEVSDFPHSDFLAHSVNKDIAVKLARSLRARPLYDRLPEVMKHVDLITHGDDGAYAMNYEYITLFNFHAFQGAYAKMNIRSTLPDKGNGTGSHFTWDEVDLGKRTFRFDPELKTYTSPLALPSLGKMLTIGVVRDMTIAEKRESAVSDITLEFAQYGRSQYEEWACRLLPICSKWGIHAHFPDWLEVVTANRSKRSYHVRGEDQATNEALKEALATILGVPIEDSVSSDDPRQSN